MNLKWSKFSSRISYSTDVFGGWMGKALRILIHCCEFDSQSRQLHFWWFWNPSMSILYKNARNVRFVLFRKNSTVWLAEWVLWAEFPLGANLFFRETILKSLDVIFVQRCQICVEDLKTKTSITLSSFKFKLYSCFMR